MPILQTPQLCMAYDDIGTGQPVLWVHGYPLNRQMWQPQLNALLDTARLLAVDLRGHGQSEKIPGPYDMDLLAEDCWYFLSTLGITQPIVLCGLSMGGYVVLAFFRKHPENVAGLILTATRSAADSEAARQSRQEAIQQLKAGKKASIFNSMLPKLLAPQSMQANPGLVERVHTIMHATHPETMINDLLGMISRPDSTPLLTNIHCPALVVAGEQDQIIPLAESQAMAAAIPSARLEIIINAGHLPNLEQPERFNAIVRQFLKEL